MNDNITTTIKTIEETTATTAETTATAETKAERTTAEIVTAMKNNESATLEEIKRVITFLKMKVQDAKNEHDNSLYIVNGNKVYLSFNFTKKNITVFSRKATRELDIFKENLHVGNNTLRKKATVDYKQFYKILVDTSKVVSHEWLTA